MISCSHWGMFEHPLGVFANFRLSEANGCERGPELFVPIKPGSEIRPSPFSGMTGEQLTQMMKKARIVFDA